MVHPGVLHGSTMDHSWVVIDWSSIGHLWVIGGSPVLTRVLIVLPNRSPICQPWVTPSGLWHAVTIKTSYIRDDTCRVSALSWCTLLGSVSDDPMKTRPTRFWANAEDTLRLTCRTMSSKYRREYVVRRPQADMLINWLASLSRRDEKQGSDVEI